MVIKQLSAGTFDVFIGDGWESFIRVQLNGQTRSIAVLSKAEHVETTPKLMELIYFKIKKQLNNNKKDKANV